MATGIRRPGEFCWINMLTQRPAQARAFFGELLGWTYGDIPGLGHLVRGGPHPIGGLFDIEGPNTPKGTPPEIGVMVKVENADAAGERVNSLGGEAAPAFDIMGNGRMSMCQDPCGARFDLWQPMKQTGTEVDSDLHGAPSWFETLTSDADRAARFYSELFGWTPEVMPMPGGTYRAFRLGGENVAGMMQITPAMGNLTPHWRTHFTVRDVDEAMREAVRLGGALRTSVKDIPGVGRFCGLASPHGVEFCVVQYIR